jgi:transcriptional regulator with XRE-family HTH domain
MQIETSVSAIEARAKQIGLSLSRLARLAGMPASTLLRHKDTHSPRLDTLEKINAALIAEERRVLAHLASLHPDFSLPEAGLPSRPTVPAPPVARPGNGGFSPEGRAA